MLSIRFHIVPISFLPESYRFSYDSYRFSYENYTYPYDSGARAMTKDGPTATRVPPEIKRLLIEVFMHSWFSEIQIA